ncbi:hypothetical protein BSKO_13396 [Bryopsis sp. KO-2023]|nr:hypothetical protein BSKO_13396 [Bryopsis sp. KO-2023]
MSAFGKLLRAGKRQCPAASVGAWSEFFTGGDAVRGFVSRRGLCATVTATPPPSVPEIAKVTAAEAFAADAEASLNETQLKESPTIDQFLESLGISKEKWDSLERKPVSKNLRLNMGVFEKYGSTLDDRKRMVLGTGASMETFRRTSPLNLEKKLSWLMEEYDLDRLEAVKIVSRHPPFVNYALKTNVGSFLTMLMETSGLDKNQVKLMLLAHPQIVGYGKKFEEVVKGAEALLGMTRKQVATCVVKCPRMLSYSIEKTTKPTLEKLLSLGLTKEEVIGLFIAAPKLIGRGFHITVDRKIEWLMSEELGISREEAVAILKTQPMAFYPKVEIWEETKKWFLGLGSTHTTEDFKRFLTEVNFSLLGRRRDGLNYILGFCKDVLNREKEEVLKCPQIFVALFLHETLPRVGFMDSKGKDVKEIPLEHLTTSTREEFYKEFDMEEVERFEKAFRNLNRDGKVEAIKTSTYPRST